MFATIDLVFALLVVAGLVAALWRPRQLRSETPTRAPGWWTVGAVILVDANNVRGSTSFGVDLVGLHEACVEATRAIDRELVLCVDHGPTPSAIDCGRIIVAFAGRRRQRYKTADDLIVAGAGRAAELAVDVVVATSDINLRRRVAAACKPSRIKIVPSSDFVDWLRSLGALRRGNAPAISGRRSRAVEATQTRIDQAAALFGHVAPQQHSRPRSCSKPACWIRDFLDSHPLVAQ